MANNPDPELIKELTDYFYSIWGKIYAPTDNIRKDKYPGATWENLYLAFINLNWLISHSVTIGAPNLRPGKIYSIQTVAVMIAEQPAQISATAARMSLRRPRVGARSKLRKKTGARNKQGPRRKPKKSRRSSSRRK
jgi:hypothetical protein